MKSFWKLFGLLLIVVGIYLFSTLQNRHMVYRYTRITKFIAYKSAFEKEVLCRSGLTGEACAQKVIELTGGIKFGIDVGNLTSVSLWYDNSDFRFERFYIGVVKSVNPKEFWIASQEGSYAKGIHKQEVSELKAELENSRNNYWKNFESTPEALQKVEYGNVVEALDGKIAELQAFLIE